MPYDFDKAKRAYRTPNGEYVSRRELRRQIDKLIEFVGKEASRIAARYQEDGGIEDFILDMQDLLKAGHVVAASVGRGGRLQMTQKDWGRVGNKVRWQNEYLKKFARKLSTGKLDKAHSAHRARAYASAIYISYTDARMEAQTEVIDGGSDEKQERPKCRLVQNSAEGCVECTADAAEGWMDVDDMTEIGGRICGDWCLCEIEFEDEV